MILRLYYWNKNIQFYLISLLILILLVLGRYTCFRFRMGFSGVKSFSEQSPPSCLLAFKLPPDAPFPFPRTCKYQLVEMSTIKNCNLDQLFIFIVYIH